MDKKDFFSCLKNLVDDFLETRPGLSLTGLAGRCGVSESMLRKAYNGQTMPHPENIIKILARIKKENNVYKLVKIFEGTPMGDYLKEHFPFYKEAGPIEQVDFGGALQDFVQMYIYKRASHKSSYSRQNVIEDWGKVGEINLNELLRKEIVFEEETGELQVRYPHYRVDPTLVKKMAPEMAKLWKAKNVGTQNFYHFFDESLNKEGVQKVREVKLEASRKISDIFGDPKYLGSIPYFSMDMADTLTLEEDSMEGGK